MPETGYTPTWAYIGYLFCIRTPGDGQRTCQHQHQEQNQRPRRVAGRLSGVARYGTGLARGKYGDWGPCEYGMCVWAFAPDGGRRTKRRTLKNGVNSLG